MQGELENLKSENLLLKQQNQEYISKIEFLLNELETYKKNSNTTEIENKNKQLEKLNSKLKDNEGILKKAFEKIKLKESELQKTNLSLKDKTENLISTEEELRQQNEEIFAQRDTLEAKTIELEKNNIKLKDNEGILKKAFEKIKLKESELQQINLNLKEKTDALIATEEELRQQNEEISAQREAIEEKSFLLERTNLKLKDNEGILKKAFEKIKQKETELEKINVSLKQKTLELKKQNEEISTQNEIIKSIAADLNIQKEKIQAQKDEIERSYNNIQMLSEIGKEITHNLDIEKIVDTVYKYVTQLMDATIFAIGLYNQEKNAIIVNVKEENETQPTISYLLTDKYRLAVICFEQKHEILINDLDTEFIKYMPERKKPVSGNYVKSIIYLPLIFKNQCIGVISSQSYNKNAYSQNDLYFLQNIAVYTGIALAHGNAFRKIDEQKLEIERTHEKITNSIIYAKRIQSAILPEIKSISTLTPKLFILFKPRDIVSGDFYWYKTTGKYYAIVAADCTGHGVPGAFMSILGISILNEIVTFRNIKMPAQVLTEMRHYIKRTLQQTGQKDEQHDGIDIAFCCISTETNELTFAGAHNPFWLFRKNETENIIEFIEIHADRQPVGIYLKEKPFTENKLQLQTDDVFYIFSDGFHSQAGGEKNLPLKSKYFKEILTNICCLPMETQKEVLNNKFETWKGNHQQTDDVTVIGIKVSALDI